MEKLDKTLKLTKRQAEFIVSTPATKTPKHVPNCVSFPRCPVSVKAPVLIQEIGLTTFVVSLSSYQFSLTDISQICFLPSFLMVSLRLSSSLTWTYVLDL